MTVASPINVTLVKRALRTVYVDALTGVGPDNADIPVVWARRDIPRKGRPFVLLTFLSGPTKVVGALVDEARTRLAPTTVTITVLSVSVDSLYFVRLNGCFASVEATGISTVDTLRDSLVASLQAFNEDVVVAATATPGELTITPNNPGSIYSTDIAPILMGAVSVGAVGVHDTVGRRRFVVACSFFAKNDVIEEAGALDYAARCEAALDLPETLESLLNQRVAIRVIGDVNHPTGISPGGARQEQQSIFDVEIHAASRVTKPCDTIDTVVGTFNIGGASQSFTAP